MFGHRSHVRVRGLSCRDLDARRRRRCTLAGRLPRVGDGGSPPGPGHSVGVTVTVRGPTPTIGWSGELAYVAGRKLVIVDRTGARQEVATPCCGVPSQPSWSPDGRWLASFRSACMTRPAGRPPDRHPRARCRLLRQRRLEAREDGTRPFSARGNFGLADAGNAPVELEPLTEGLAAPVDAIEHRGDRRELEHRRVELRQEQVRPGARARVGDD
jgi:hypothetical protein